MEARAEINIEWDIPSIIAAAGSTIETAYISGTILICPNVAQEALDDSIANYDHAEATAPTVTEKIAALESSVTKRWLRGAALGDTYAISKIQDVEDQIAVLRA